MNARPAVLCPVDFSEASRAALGYARAIAEHFGASLTVLAVDDPLLSDVVAATGRALSLEDETLDELRRFAAETLEPHRAGAGTVQFRVVTGQAAPEILRQASETGADLIVMSSQGRTGVRRLFFGSTTERVLRETTVPVLVTPDDRERVSSVSEIGALIHHIVAPIDLTAASTHQLSVAAGLAQAFSVPLILAHVVEPLYIPARVRAAVPGLDAERRADFERRLADMAAPFSPRVPIEEVIVSGEPSEEIVKLAEVRDAQLIVMGLHSSGLLGPRMGSVTYRVLCLTHALVLALPPKAVTVRSAQPFGVAEWAIA
jgi:nucleotide-binding universal stress UspA family protein